MKQTNQVLTKDELKVNVTKDIIPRLAKKYMNSISRVTKNGSIYEITFAEGYTIFGIWTENKKSKKYCRNNVV